MADIGERLGGDDLKFSIDQPLRIIIGGPPHSGKSTLMNLLEDRFQYYQIPVQLLDLDLSAPTPLKTGFTEQREKRKWTSSLADEARSMFEEAEGVQVVLGDSVGLISEINEIISQPADVAILLVSGGHGDYDDTYRKVVRKWKEYYEDIRKPLLVVLRSTMNPRDESMFDPRDNYGVIAGLDRDAYQAQVISGHYNYEGDFPTNACLEGIVFEIAQSFDLTVRSPTDPDHLSILNQKWPDLKDKKTWTPPEGSMLGGIERAYFEERGRVPADQRAESFEFLTKSGHEVQWDDGSFYMTFKDPVDGYGDVNGDWYGGENQSPDEIILDVEPAWNEETDEEYDVPSLHIEFSQVESYGIKNHNMSVWDGGVVSPELFGAIQEGLEGMVSDYGAEYYTKYYLPNRLDPKVGDEAMFEGGEIRITAMERNPDVIFYTYLDEDGKSDGFIHTRDKAKFVDRWTPFPMEKDTVILSNYGDKDDLSFKEWADQEMLTHGKKESFDDWLNDELSHHGDNMTLQDWGQHELDSHYERYGAEFEIMPSVDVEGIGIVSGPLVREYSHLTGGRIDSYDIYDDDAAEEIISIPANDPRFPLQDGELELIEAMVYDYPHPRINDSWGELNEDGMFWASVVMDTLSNYQPYAAEMANWSGRPKTSKPYRGLESKTRKRIKQEAAYSQMMIGSLIGLGAGLWAVSRWKENQEGQ